MLYLSVPRFHSIARDFPLPLLGYRFEDEAETFPGSLTVRIGSSKDTSSLVTGNKTQQKEKILLENETDVTVAS